MVKGTVRIETRITMGDEYGVYRITEDQSGYLTFSFDKADEARVAAKMLAELLKVSFEDHIYIEPKIDKLNSAGMTSNQFSSTVSNTSDSLSVVNTPKLSGARTKPKRVKGAAKLCLELLSIGTPENEVKEIISALYREAGHSETRVKNMVYGVLYDAKRELRKRHG